MRQEPRLVLLIAALAFTGCAETLPYCPTADFSAECHDLNTRTDDCDGPRTEQPKPIEPDYDRRDSS